MFKRLLLMEFREGDFKFKNISKAFLKICQFIFTFAMIFNMCNKLISNVGFNKAITFISSANIVIIYGFHIIIHREFLEGLKKDGVMMFLREDAFSYVQGKINILFMKYLVALVIPTFLPFAIKEKGIVIKIFLILSVIFIAYLINTTILYGVLFLKKKSEDGKIFKIIFFLIATFLFIGFFTILTWVSQIILTLFFEKEIFLITDIVTREILIRIIFIATISFGILSLFLIRYMKENIHILYEEERSKEKDRFGIGIKLLKSSIIKDKRFVRDIIVFFRDRPFLKAIGILIVFMQTLSMVAFYFTDIIAPENINDMINLSQYHFLVIFAISIMCFLLNLIINISGIRVKEELIMANQFSLDVNMKKLIMQKAKGYFIICCIPIILGVVLMISLKGNKGAYVQYFYVLIPIIFLFKFISLTIVKIVNAEGAARTIKISYIIAVAIGLLFYCVNSLMYSFKLEVPDSKVRILNILLILITITIYYIEVIELKISKRWTRYDRNR